MGYYMRYIMADERDITLADIEHALQAVDTAYALEPDQVPDIADVMYGGRQYAQIEINHPDEEIFEDDINEFKDLVGAGDDPNAALILNTLENATAIIAVEIFWETGQAEESLARIDPLWDWLFAARKGIAQADGEGFYDASGLILGRKFTL